MADPVTFGTIIKAAIALGQLLSESDKEKRDEAWRSETTAALRRIEFKVDEILREVRELRLVINEDLNRLYLNQRDALYAAYLLRLTTLMSAALTAQQLQELETLITAPANGLLDSVTSFSKDRDSSQRPYYAGFSVALRGLGALFLAADLASFDRSRVLPVCQAFVSDFINPSLDPQALDSFAAQAVAERALQQRQRQWLAAHATGQSWMLGATVRRLPTRVNTVESVTYIGVAITGSPESGYNGTRVVSQTELPQFPGVPLADDDPGNQQELHNRLVGIVNSEAEGLTSSARREATLNEAIGGLESVRVSLQTAIAQS